jgi:hypothetical protein
MRQEGIGLNARRAGMAHDQNVTSAAKRTYTTQRVRHELALTQEAIRQNRLRRTQEIYSFILTPANYHIVCVDFYQRVHPWDMSNFFCICPRS